MKQVLVETRLFTAMPSSLSENNVSERGLPLVESGITVGVSSRGMGSLKPMGEVQEVQDDFELLCWDFVSTPSNPDSFMHLVKEGLEFKSSNSYTKVNSVITEILCAHGSCPII